MVELAEISLEKLQQFTDRSNTLLTIDAPLFGSVMIFNGRVLSKGPSYVEPEKIGNSIGFPAYEQILAEAKDLTARLEMRKGVKQDETQARQTLMQKGAVQVSRIRSALKAHFGPNSERLIEFGARPVRPRKKSPAKPEPPVPPPATLETKGEKPADEKRSPPNPTAP